MKKYLIPIFLMAFSFSSLAQETIEQPSRRERKRQETQLKEEKQKQKEASADLQRVENALMRDSNLQNLEEKTKEYFASQDVVNGTHNIEGYAFRGVSVFLEGRVKSVEKAWRNYVKNSNEIKLKSRKTRSFISKKKVPYWKAREIQLTNVTGRTGDLISVFQKENGRVKMTVIYKLGYNTAINPDNFPQENENLVKYVEYFSQVNFREYYDENIKTIKKSIKVTSKELRKETRVFKKLSRRYKRKYTRKDKTDSYLEMEMAIQNKLLNTLKLEKNNYQFLIVEYKNRNSQIRSALIKNQ